LHVLLRIDELGPLSASLTMIATTPQCETFTVSSRCPSLMILLAET